MHRAFALALLVLTAGTFLPQVVSHAAAQSAGRCCNSCQRPVARCSCEQPRLEPVVETQYTQRRVLREREQVSTRYRREAVKETIPTTVTENVTVDEGGYQTVWVPKLTTRPVARTVYQTRTSYRDVPYQVTQRIPEYVCETVPQQTVRYVPAGSASALRSSGTTAYSSPLYSNRVNSQVARSDRDLGLGLDPLYSNTPSISRYPTAPSSNYPSFRYDEFEPAEGSYMNSSLGGGPVLSVPAPSAAQVWRSRGSTYR